VSDPRLDGWGCPVCSQQEMNLAEWVNRLPKSHLAHKEYTRLAARIAELEAQFAEARRDSERLDWLEAQEVIAAGYVVIRGGACYGAIFEWDNYSTQTLRAAIDALMAEREVE